MKRKDRTAQLDRTFREIREDYAFDPSIFSTEDDRTRRVKEIIDKELPQVDRVLFLSYVDCGSLRKLARRIGVSEFTAQREIARIRKDILQRYDPTL